MKTASIVKIVISIALWTAGALLLVPLNKWLVSDSKFNAPKTVVLIVGVIIIAGFYNNIKNKDISFNKS